MKLIGYLITAAGIALGIYYYMQYENLHTAAFTNYHNEVKAKGGFMSTPEGLQESRIALAPAKAELDAAMKEAGVALGQTWLFGGGLVMLGAIVALVGMILEWRGKRRAERRRWGA
jgi:hypothetical protein